MPSAKPWKKTNEAKLIELRRRGLSYSLIAAELKMSRNAVIGKGWRLKLHGQSTVTKEKDIMKDAKPFKAVAGKSTKKPLIFNSSAANRKPPSIELVTKAVDLTEMGIKISKLEWSGGVPSNCRAILRGEGKEAIYCGKKNKFGSSYCPKHTELYYHRPARDIYLKKEELR